jgi:adenine-specific DNA-methyltransferase
VSRLTDLIAHAKAKDPQLGADLDREFKVLSSRLPFGLNFERHRPEAVELPQRPIRKGDKVHVLPKRGFTKKGDQRLWQVKTLRKSDAGNVADLELFEAANTKTQSVALDDLVVVAEFRDTIYPGLVSTGKVQRGEDKPFHTVINGENYHVLKALTYTHRGKVDAIYIDPPYNSGAKDWKYNNDYVEGDDLYRHSKWLAMMERRLLVAKELVAPAHSVLIVTIDEKEYLRLGLLLEQVFPETTIQMVSSQINPKGVSREGSFRRSDEYLFFVMFGTSRPIRMPLSSEWSTSTQIEYDTPEAVSDEAVFPDWTSMMRRGSEARRIDRPSMFYPIYADPNTRRIIEIGEPIPEGEHRPPNRDGLVAILPVRRDGSEGRWQIGATELRARMEQGRVRLGRPTSYGFVVNYLPDGAYRDVMSNRFAIEGYAPDGSLIAIAAEGYSSRIAPTQWKIASHNASENGSTLLASFMPKRKFPYPKSLYAVEDALRFFVSNKPESIVLDFFAGSGTTAQAVMRLNKQDGGRRQCIWSLTTKLLLMN